MPTIRSRTGRVPAAAAVAVSTGSGLSACGDDQVIGDVGTFVPLEVEDDLGVDLIDEGIDVSEDGPTSPRSTPTCSTRARAVGAW